MRTLSTLELYTAEPSASKRQLLATVLETLRPALPASLAALVAAPLEGGAREGPRVDPLWSNLVRLASLVHATVLEAGAAAQAGGRARAGSGAAGGGHGRLGAAAATGSALLHRLGGAMAHGLSAVKPSPSQPAVKRDASAESPSGPWRRLQTNAELSAAVSGAPKARLSPPPRAAADVEARRSPRPFLDRSWTFRGPFL